MAVDLASLVDRGARRQSVVMEMEATETIDAERRIVAGALRATTTRSTGKWESGEGINGSYTHYFR
jgi:hypothetical protein